MGRRSLQIATGIVAAIPVATGMLALYFGARTPLYKLPLADVTPLLDSNYRFLGGEWLGLGLAAYWLIPTIERQTVLFRAIWCAVFLGGMGRLISLLAFGLPSPLYSAFFVVEICGAPTFIYWQHQVAKAATGEWRAGGAAATAAPPA